VVGESGTCGGVACSCPTLTEGCVRGDWDKSAFLTISDVDVSDVEFQSRELRFTGTVGYRLSEAAHSAELRVYNRLLEEVEAICVDPTTGHHDVSVDFTVDPDPMGQFHFVISAVETEASAASNRDRAQKPALQKGATKDVPPRALDMYGRTNLGIPTYPQALKARNEQQHAPQGTAYPSPAYAATLNGHEIAPVFWRLSSLDADQDPNPQADAIFYYIGHGAPGVLYTDEFQMPTKFVLHSGQGTNGNDVYYMGNMPSGSLSRCALVMLVGCSTAVDPDGAGGDPSILQAFMDKGAACGIGSFADIYEPYPEQLSDAFWEYACRDGQSIEEAFQNALDDSETPLQWFTDPVTQKIVAGDGSLTLRPARYR